MDAVCYGYNEPKPCMYRQNVKKDSLFPAKRKKRTAKLIGKAIKKKLQCIRRDRGYIGNYLEEGKGLSTKHTIRLETICKVCEQQKQMYETGQHSVPDRIVSISQPYIRSIVRDGAKPSTEFGTRFALSIDNNGMACIEKQSFDAYNESDVLIGAIERYGQWEGHYPECVLVDKIYLNRKNLSFCKEPGIQISSSPPDRKQEDRDAVDGIEVERRFSLDK